MGFPLLCPEFAIIGRHMQQTHMYTRTQKDPSLRPNHFGVLLGGTSSSCEPS